MGSVWAEEAAERCLTAKGAGGENLQRPEDVEAQAKGWKKVFAPDGAAFCAKAPRPEAARRV